MKPKNGAIFSPLEFLHFIHKSIRSLMNKLFLFQVSSEKLVQFLMHSFGEYTQIEIGSENIFGEFRQLLRLIIYFPNYTFRGVQIKHAISCVEKLVSNST